MSSTETQIQEVKSQESRRKGQSKKHKKESSPHSPKSSKDKSKRTKAQPNPTTTDPNPSQPKENGGGLSLLSFPPSAGSSVGAQNDSNPHHPRATNTSSTALHIVTPIKPQQRSALPPIPALDVSNPLEASNSRKSTDAHSNDASWSVNGEARNYSSISLASNEETGIGSFRGVKKAGKKASEMSKGEREQYKLHKTIRRVQLWILHAISGAEAMLPENVPTWDAPPKEDPIAMESLALYNDLADCGGSFQDISERDDA